MPGHSYSINIFRQKHCSRVFWGVNDGPYLPKIVLEEILKLLHFHIDLITSVKNVY